MLSLQAHMDFIHQIQLDHDHHNVLSDSRAWRAIDNRVPFKVPVSCRHNRLCWHHVPAQKPVQARAGFRARQKSQGPGKRWTPLGCGFKPPAHLLGGARLVLQQQRGEPWAPHRLRVGRNARVPAPKGEALSSGPGCSTSHTPPAELRHPRSEGTAP